MKKGQIFVYYGKGKGKTCLVVGRGIRAIGDGLQVVMIQFLGTWEANGFEILKRFEPDFRLFRFGKNRLPKDIEEELIQKEVEGEVRHAFKFANKIVDTDECDMLILDGILDCVAKGYLSLEELEDLLNKQTNYFNIILTGNDMIEEIAYRVDAVCEISGLKYYDEDIMQ